MSILSANVSLPKAVEYRGRRLEKDIFRDPVAGSVMKCEVELMDETPNLGCPRYAVSKESCGR